MHPAFSHVNRAGKQATLCSRSTSWARTPAVPLPGATPGALREGRAPITTCLTPSTCPHPAACLESADFKKMIANSTKEWGLGVSGSRKLAAAPHCMWTRQTFLKGRERSGHHRRREVPSGALHTSWELLLAGPVTITH